MRQRERYVRPMCPPHQWTLVGTENCDDGFTVELKRKCVECKRIEVARPFRFLVADIPRAVLHLADVDWHKS